MKHNETYQLKEGVTKKFQTPEDHTHFFGYYYTSPLNSNGTDLLAHRITFDGRYISETDRVEVGYYDMNSGNWHQLGNTGAFNWQQGSMLQWLGQDFEKRVIYNDRAENHFKSVIVELKTGKRKELNNPIYVINRDAKRALSINYERFVFCNPHYSYKGVVKPKWDCPIHSDDGIFQIDLVTGESDLLIRTEDIAGIDPAPEMGKAKHYLDHMMWNFSGTRFIFLHRYIDSAGRLTTRLFSADPDGSNLYRFPDCNLYTHLAWRGDKEFFVWARKSSYRRKAYESFSMGENPLLKPVVQAYRWCKKHRIVSKATAERVAQGGAAYMRMQDGSSRMEPTAPNVLLTDGHPSWSRCGRFMLTDTYADEENFRHLMIYDYENQRLYPLGKFYSPYNVHGYRCDLHPRFSHDEQNIIIDTAHTGNRQIWVLGLDWDKLATY
jgi:hypothetical protein